VRRLLALLLLSACGPRLSPAAAQDLAAAAQHSEVQPASDDPTAASTDLAGLGAVVGDARVVGLGFPVPGTSELPRLQQRLVAHMVDELGFTAVALDVDATAVLVLDAYVHGAKVDLDAALLALRDPQWATVEVRALLAWMRSRNAARPGSLRLFGLDPRDGDAAAGHVIDYFRRVDPAFVPKARPLLARGEQLAVDTVIARLDERREAYAAQDPAAWVEARQQAEIAAQARRMGETWEYEALEFARARNAEWALAHAPGAGKLVIVAHNRQVAAEVPGAAPSMGNFLRQWFGAGYRPIGASVGEGFVLRGEGAQALCSAALPPPAAGTLDAALGESDRPFALVDLRGLMQPVLRRPQRLREGDLQGVRYQVIRPALAFDALLAARRVHAATPLGAGPIAAMRPEGPCYTRAAK
jgi:erythromycin esterase